MGDNEAKKVVYDSLRNDKRPEAIQSAEELRVKYNELAEAQQNLLELEQLSYGEAIGDQIHRDVEAAQAVVDGIESQIDSIHEKATEAAKLGVKALKEIEGRTRETSSEISAKAKDAERLMIATQATRAAFMLLPAAIGGATDSSKSLNEVIGNIAKLSIPSIVAALKPVIASLGVAKGAAGAFNAAMLGPLKAVVGVAAAAAAISVLIKWIDKSIVTFKEQKEIVDELSESIKGLQSEYDALSANENRTTEQENYLKLLEKELEIEKELLAIEAEKLVEEFFDPNKITGYSEATKAKRQMEELKELREELEGLNKKISADDYIVDEDDTERIRELREEVLNLETSLIGTAKTVQGMSKNLVNASPKLDTFARELDKVIYSAEELAERNKWNFAEEVAKKIAEGEKATDEWQRSLESFGFTSEEALAILEGKLNEVKAAYDEVEGSKPSTSEEVKSLEELTKEFEEVANKLQAYNKILDELNSKEGLSAQSKENIITKHQELLPYLDDEQELRKQLIKIISDEEETQRQAYINMIMISEDFFNAKIKGNDI